MRTQDLTYPRAGRWRAVTSVLGAGVALGLSGCSSGDVASNSLLDGGFGGAAGSSSDAGEDASAGAAGSAGSAGHAGAGGSAGGGGSAGTQSTDAGADADAGASSGPCPADMILIDAPELPAPVCMDRYEAPNREGELPLVMLNFDESEAWCARHAKRLCFDDEWTYSCAGPEGYKYPYGDTRQPGVCNDAKVWKTYSQSLLSGWPYTFDGSGYDSLEELLSGVSEVSSSAKAAADHVRELYQAEAAGNYPQCLGVGDVRDLTGSVEEWTRRRSGGAPQFHGNLKGRYWADTRTCQNNITSHGDGFRFYEIGFRCCTEPEL